MTRRDQEIGAQILQRQITQAVTERCHRELAQRRSREIAQEAVMQRLFRQSHCEISQRDVGAHARPDLSRRLDAGPGVLCGVSSRRFLPGNFAQSWTLGKIMQLHFGLAQFEKRPPRSEQRGQTLLRKPCGAFACLETNLCRHVQ